MDHEKAPQSDMRKEIEEIRDALSSIDALDEETGEALQSLEDSIDELESHPAADRVRDVASETAARVRAGRATGEGEEEPPISGRWASLRGHLDEWEDRHPRVTMVIGRMADALAAVGL